LTRSTAVDRKKSWCWGGPAGVIVGSAVVVGSVVVGSVVVGSVVVGWVVVCVEGGSVDVGSVDVGAVVVGWVEGGVCSSASAAEAASIIHAPQTTRAHPQPTVGMHTSLKEGEV
jgi:hypothetical protein